MIDISEIKNMKVYFRWDNVIYYGTCEYNGKIYWFSCRAEINKKIGKYYKVQYKLDNKHWENTEKYGKEHIDIEREITYDTVMCLFETTFCQRLKGLKDEMFKDALPFDYFIIENGGEFMLDFYYHGLVENMTEEQKKFAESVPECED